MSPSPIQLLIVFGIIALLFGASRFSELGKGLGEGIRNFKKGIADDEPSAKDSSSKPAKSEEKEKEKDA